jgi:uncharacterized membrane protein YjgN (DUF898 family)
MGKRSSTRIIRFSLLGSAHGEKLRVFKNALMNLLKIVLTFGIYGFWATARSRQDQCKSVLVGNHSLEYLGTGKELFDGFLRWVRFFGSVLMSLELLGQVVDSDGASQNLLIMAKGFALWIALVVGQYYWRAGYLEKLSWQKKSFVVHHQILEYLKTHLNWTMLAVLSFGLLAPIRRFKLTSLVIEQLEYAGQQFKYDGEIREFTYLFFRGLGLTVLTLGIYGPWHWVALKNYELNHTKVGPYRFKSLLRGRDLMWVLVENVLLLLSTCGLAWPWVRQSILRLHLQQMALVETLTMSPQPGAVRTAMGPGRNSFSFEPRDYPKI